MDIYFLSATFGSIFVALGTFFLKTRPGLYSMILGLLLLSIQSVDLQAYNFVALNFISILGLCKNIRQTPTAEQSFCACKQRLARERLASEITSLNGVNR